MGLIQHRKRWRYFVILLMSLLPLTTGADGSVTPEQVKALFLFNLTKFVRVSNPLHSINTICYYEKPDVPENESVGQILDKYLKSHTPEPSSSASVKRLQAVGNFSKCDLLFIPANEEDNIDDILSKVGSSSILTVSDAKRFILRGGMIGFVLDDSNHVRMQGNLVNMKANDVDADAQLLGVMQQVVQ